MAGFGSSLRTGRVNISERSILESFMSQLIITITGPAQLHEEPTLDTIIEISAKTLRTTSGNNINVVCSVVHLHRSASLPNHVFLFCHAGPQDLTLAQSEISLRSGILFPVQFHCRLISGGISLWLISGRWYKDISR